MTIPLDPAMLAYICANPDDDAARLGAADWWSERGGQEESDRAEFIRLQMELAGPLRLVADRCRACGWLVQWFHRDDQAGCKDCVQRQELWQRERSLLTWEWLSDLGGNFCGGGRNALFFWWDGSGGRGIEFHFRRGFVEEITCSWADWCRHAHAIRAAQPVTRVRLTSEPRLEELWEDGARYFYLAGFPQTVQEERSFKVHDALAELWPGITTFELPPQESPVDTSEMMREERLRWFRHRAAYGQPLFFSNPRILIDPPGF